MSSTLSRLHSFSHSGFKPLRRAVALLLLGAILTTTGCFGQFPLTRQVYQYNKDASNTEFVQTMVFWVFIIFPVYIGSGLIDTLILNPIEFWGSKPVDVSSVDGDLQIQAQLTDGRAATLRLHRRTSDEYAVLSPIDGSPVGLIRRAENGDALLCSADGRLMQRLPAAAH